MDIDLPSCSQSVEKKNTLKKARRQVQKAPDLCEICLAKSTGYHYEAVSCNSCKAFYRRIITSKLNYKCKFENECFAMLQPGGRIPRCKACRYEKCIEAGMNPLRIHSEFEVEIMKNKLPMVVIEKPRQTIEDQVGELIDKMIRLDVQVEKLRGRVFIPERFPTLKECIKQEISMLSLANDYETTPLFARDSRLPHVERWHVYEVWTQIELAKALPFFSDLSESDKFFLLRDTLWMCNNLTKAFNTYKKKSDRLLRPDGSLNSDIFLRFDEKLQNCVNNNTMRCLIAILRDGINRVEYVLLKALVLTNPAISELSKTAQQYLMKTRQVYTTALFRYIMAKHGASGPARFANVLGFIDVLEHQQRDQRDIYLIMRLAENNNIFISILDEVMKH